MLNASNHFRGTTIVALFLASAALSAGAQAQVSPPPQANGQAQAQGQGQSQRGGTYGDWVVECNETPASQGKKVCVLTQTIVNKEKNQRLLKLIMGPGRQGPTFTALLPLGTHIPAGVTATLENGKPLAMTLQTCLQQGCIATLPLNAALAKSLRSAKQLVVSFTLGPEGKPIILNGSPRGIDAGLQAINL